MVRRTPLKRAAALSSDPAKRQAFIQRGRGSLSRSRPAAARPDPERVAWQRAWNRCTQRVPCAMCGSYIGRTGHHVLPLQVLKREGIPDWLWWDTRNHLCLCMEPSSARCHQRHELYVSRVPRAVVLAGAPRALEFAAEVGLLHIFDREYPA